MNGLDELRRTLESHAGDVASYGVDDRRTAVHERIDVARRRRAAGAVAAVATVAAVAVAVGVALLPGSPEKSGPDPADKVLVFGIEVPRTMTSLGFTYELADTVDDLGPGGSFEVAPSDKARLISWATKGDDQRVDVQNPIAADDGSSVTYAGDFTGFTLVDADYQGTIDFVSSDSVAVATYEITDERPAGTTVDGITFRDTVGDSRLLGASIGEPGQSAVSVPVSSAQGPVQARVFCSGGAPRTKAAISPVVMGVAGSPGCLDAIPVDAAQHPAIDVTGDPEIALEARSPDGATFESPELRVGLAIYEAVKTTDGLPDVFEDDGHRWRLTESGPVGSGSDLAVPQGAARRLAVVELPRRAGLIRLDFDGRYAGSSTSGGSRLVTELPPDVSTVDLSVSGGPATLDDAVIGFFVLDE